MVRGMRREKGANPVKVRRQILNIVIIHIELKSCVSNVLKYYDLCVCVKILSILKRKQ